MTEFEKLILERLDGLTNEMQFMKQDMQSMNTRLDNIEKKVDRLEIKQDVHTRKIEELTYQQAAMRHEAKQEFHKLNDEMETVLAILEGQNLMPTKVG